MEWNKRTVRGYDFYEVSSSLQKAIRRCDKKVAAYFAIELFESGYYKYVWKRLFTISAEDVQEYVTAEIEALFNGFSLVNSGRSGGDKPKGRIFITKAVFLLCDAVKSRDTDHMNIIIYDHKLGITDDEINQYINEARSEGRMSIPEYAMDVHTMGGKKAGKTKGDFVLEEMRSLKPVQMSLFDDIAQTYADSL